MADLGKRMRSVPTLGRTTNLKEKPLGYRKVTFGELARASGLDSFVKTIEVLISKLRCQVYVKT